MNDQALLKQARAALPNAYAPYSGVHVAAALLAKSKKVYLGCNVENSSFGATICAERSALACAVSAGEREFSAIAIASNLANITPCGICRQSLAEFSPSLRVILEQNGVIVAMPLSDLLPSAFSLQKDK